MVPKWYLVKTKPLNEARIQTRPLFPTCLFVRFAMEHLLAVRYMRGVARVISFCLGPLDVDQDMDKEAIEGAG